MTNHMFDISIATEYGLDEAILLQNLDFWCSKNKANNHNFKEGNYWTYNSVSAFNELFPYLTTHRISKALKHLEKEELILTGNYNDNPYDRTKWYAVSEKGKCIIQNKKMHSSNSANGELTNRKCTLPKSDKCSTTTDINTNSKPDVNGKTDKTETLYNQFKEICTLLPKPRSLTDSRKKAIRSILKSYSIDEVIEVFNNAQNSEFLTVKWQASFDWLLMPKNFIKVLEGNYKNKQTSDPNAINTSFASGDKWDRIAREQEEKERLSGKCI